MSAPTTPDRTPIRLGRFELLNAFTDRVLSKHLSATTVKVWLVLFREIRNGVARVAQTDIATRIGHHSPRDVRRSIQELKCRGLLVVVRQGGRYPEGQPRRRGQGRPLNVYRLTVPRWALTPAQS